LEKRLASKVLPGLEKSPPAKISPPNYQLV